MSVTVDDGVPLDSIELSDRSFWERPESEREAAFATLRREAPVRYFREFEWVPGFDVGDGFWALTRHDDVWNASRHPALFSSVPSIVIRRDSACVRAVPVWATPVRSRARSVAPMPAAPPSSEWFEAVEHES